MKERVFKKLPAIHQTDVLDKFFKNTVDQWFHEEDVVRAAGFIGRKTPGIHDFENDFYFPEIDLSRENYQFEPVLTTKDIDTADIDNLLFYDDVLKLLSVEGSNISNHDRLFKSKAYSWAPPIDIDKFINYENYYWYDNGPVKIEITAPLSAPIVVTTDIIGKASFTSSNGIKFSDGMKVEFSGANITPATHLNKEFIVEGVGTSIQLIDVGSDDFNHTLPYMIPGSETEHLWDTDFWDEVVWAGTIVGEATPLEQRIDYITIKRGAINQNAWSRTNGWYHKDVLLQVTGAVTGTTFTKETLHPWDIGTAPYDTTEWDSSLDILTETFSLDSFRQAKRPIIEFDNDLELYKYGLEGIGSVSIASIMKYDDVHGATSPEVDSYTLQTGDTIIFLNDNLLNFNVWDADGWDPGSHPAGVQVPPGPYADMPAGSAGDWDITMDTGASAFGTIFTVSFSGTTCVLTATTVVKLEQKVFAKKGLVYLGREFYWNGFEWTLSQLKDKQNDEPLFQLYDSDKNKLDDISVYATSTFAGSTIFSYKTATSGTTDTYVGKALQYKEFGQTADIVFTNNFEDTIDNVIGYKYANQYNLSGSGAGPKDKMTSTFVNGWNPTDTYSKQLVTETFIASTTGAQAYALNVTPVVSGGIADVIVTVDGVIATQSTATRPYDYGIVDRVLTFTTNKIITEKQVIEVRANTKTFVNINENQYYEIPDNLEANPDNLDIGEATASELQDHFSSIIKAQTGVIGNEIGTNNYRDTAKDRSKGTKILQHESSLLPMMVLLSKSSDFNITSSIRYNQNEYEVFKSKFLQKAEYYGTQTDTADISKFVDTVLEDMYSLRSNLKIFTETNAFAYGLNYKVQELSPDYNITYIDMEETVTSAEIDNREKIVHIYFTKAEDRADSKSPTLLLKDADYTINVTLDELGSSVTRITFNTTIDRASFVEIRVFENIQNSFVPLTPSMVGMYSVYIPRVLIDDTYVGADRKFIQGHDGSRTLFYDDFRDDALLELEKRIYNAIPGAFVKEYLPAINYFKVAPGKFRTTDYSRFEFNRILEPIIQRWCVEHDVDLITHRAYDQSLPFTWNYSKEIDKDERTVAGNWRGIYLDYYDTVNPHTRPWEMLGLSIRPSWWISQYGTDYGSNNTALWSDLENGIIRNGPRENYTDSSYLTDNPFRRVGLSTVIPVDHLGKLLDPVEAGIFGTPSAMIIAGEYSVPNIVDRHLPWDFGDVGPAEYSAHINIIWPWVLNKLLYLTRPTEYCTKAWDTLNFTRPVANKKQVVFKDTNKRKQLKDFKFYSDTDVVYGYQAWVYSHLLSESRTYANVISNVFKTSGVALGYKAGGFISNNFTAIADSYSTTRTTNSIFIPEENKTVLLYHGFSEGLRVYSGVKVTITETGYTVSGFDSFYSNFRIIPCIDTGTYDVVEIGNVQVNKYREHYDVLIEVAYGTEYQTVQDVYTFLIGYGKYLESMGFVFDEYDDVALDIINWEYAAKEFLFWCQMSSWEAGAFLSLSPSASKVKINTTNIGRIDTIKEIINATYSIVDKDGRAMAVKDLDIKRDNDYFSVSNITGTGIFGLKLNPYRSEHAIVFDNITEFNDLIYDPLLRLRQARIKLNLVKSGNWTGRLNAPGYIIRGNTIIPNFDTTANDYRKLFKVRDVPVTETLLDSARHLVGYQQRDYLDNITEDENTSFEFFQGMLRQKGNLQSINKLLRNSRLDNNDMSIFEEYAFKIGEFGATTISTNNEIQIKSSDVRIQNPLVEFTYEDSSIDVLIDDLIQINYTNDSRWVNKPTFPTTQVWPKLAIGYTSDTWLPTAGYVHNEDVTYRAFDVKALAALNTIAQAITEPATGSVAHVANTDNNEFGVYKLINTDLKTQHSQLLSTGKTEISVVDEVVPTVVGSTSVITAKVGDTLSVSLDGNTPESTTVVTLSSSSFESTPPVMYVNVSNADLIKKDESIYVKTPASETEVIFSSIPFGPVTVIGKVFEPKITATGPIKIDDTTITFTAGDTLHHSSPDASYTGGIIGNINIHVPDVTASNHNGYLRLTTINSSLIFNTEESIAGTLVDSDVGILSDLYYNALTQNEIYNDLIAANISDIFMTLDTVKQEVTLSGQYAEKIEVKKGVGNAYRSLHFTDSSNNEVSYVDNRVVDMANVIKDINAAITNEDFLASTDVNGNLQMVYNGVSLSVAGTALAGIGLQAQTSALVSSPVQSHPFKNNDVIVLTNVTDKSTNVIDIAGGYVVEEQVVYVNKSVEIVSGVVTITDLDTSVVTTLTNVSTIPIYDIVSADRDFIKDFMLHIDSPLSPNEIQIGDSGTADSILSGFTVASPNYTSSNIGPYTTIVAGAGNVTISTVSDTAFTSGRFTASMVIKKKGIFVIDDFMQKVATSSDVIQLWHPRRFKTKTEAFENVRNDKSFYSVLDLVWIDNEPNGWFVGKLVDLKNHYGMSSLTISSGGINYSPSDINKEFSIDTFSSDTKVQPVGKITGIKYNVSSATVTAGGLGYTSPPLVSFSGGGVITNATAKSILKTVISSVTITDAGAGYQNLPGVEVYESLIYNATIWNVEHNLNQQYVNLEIIDHLHNTFSAIYEPPTITYVDVNTLTIDWGTTPKVGYVDVIKSQYVSPLFETLDVWSVQHNLALPAGEHPNVDIIYDDNTDAISHLDYPLIEYTDANNLIVLFPTGVKRSGRVAVTYIDSYVPGAAASTGETHTQTVAAKTWTFNHGLGKRYVNVDVAFLGSDIDMSMMGNRAIVQHNFSQQYVNIALIDEADNLISNMYANPSIEYFSTNSLRISGGTTKITKASIVKSKFVSSLQSSANIWTITHSLNQDIANIDIIYNDNTSADSKYDYPLIEYTNNNTIKVIFPSNVAKSGYAVVTHNDDNGASPGFGYEHTEASASTTWNVNHNLGKKYPIVDVAVLGSNINWANKNVAFTITHNLNKQYINVELIDINNKIVHGTYNQAQLAHTDANNLTITYNESTPIAKINVIDSDFVSPLQSSANTWTITHSLNQDIANVDVIYNDTISAKSSYDKPLIEYTDNNNVKVIFPVGVSKAGYVAVNNSVAASNSFEHTQAAAATTWTITHGLANQYVNVDVAVLGASIQAGDYTATINSAKYYGISGMYDQPEITCVDANTVTITFATATAGKAIVSEGTTLSASAGTYYNIKGLYDYPAVKYVDDNNLTITFDTAIAGKAVISGGNTFSTTSDEKYYNIKGNYDFPVINHVSANQLTATFDTPRVGKLMVSAGKGIRDDDSVIAVHMEVGTDGGCVGMAINTAGTGYSVNDTILVTGGTGVSATGTVSSVGVGQVGSITVTNPGSGYTSAPTVTIAAPGLGTQATATATVASGAVTGITITGAGTGYTSVPSIVISGGGGSSAVAVATIVPVGSVAGIAIAIAGDYTVLPSHTNCATTASPSSGRTGLTLDLLFKVKALDVTISDSFQTAPDIKIFAPSYGGGGGCTPRQATATAIISGVVDSIEMLTNGQYASAPTIAFTPIGSGEGAIATANITGPVIAVSIQAGGDITYLPTSLSALPADYLETIDGTGLTLDVAFTEITSFDTWFEAHRVEEQRIDTALFDIATLFDTKEKIVDAHLSLLDLPKGIISGLADAEISYRLSRDPARYNVTDDDSSLVNEDLLWNDKQAGHLWWDISTVKFYDAEQGDNRYRRKYWNQVFPGSSIDIYEWTQSTVVPAGYKGIGTVRSTTQYSQIDEWDVATNKFVTNYYFWVKNKTATADVAWRSRSASDVATYISSLSNTKWYAPISNHYERIDDIFITLAGALQTISTTGVDPSIITDIHLNGIKITYTNGVVASDGTITSVILTTPAILNDMMQVTYKKPGGAMIINNVDHLITAEDSRLQLEYKTKANEGNVHKQWSLLRKNDPRSTIPPYFLNKMIDSLVGYNKAGLAIPDTAILHEEMRYGTLYRPRQTWFKNVKLARKNFVVLMNTILTLLPINDNKTGWDADVYTNQFIEYVDWWETDYSTATVIKYTVDTIAKRKLLTGLLDGDIVKVDNDGTNRWRVYKYVLATETFLKIGAEKQTINFKTTTYTDTFTLEQSTDFRAIINAIFNNVFTINWLVKTNEVFFGMIAYVLSEQGDVDWIFKSSYLNISSAEDDVKQIPNFKVELLPHVQEYINEVKPYTSKVREFRGVKNLQLEIAKSHITDFDNPPYYNSTTGKVQPLLTGVHPSYDEVLGTGIYKDYLDNHTNTNLLRGSKVSLIFDRVSNNILPAKTYLTTGNVGVDSRTVHHELALTDAQRDRNAIIDLNTRTTVGDLVTGDPSDHASHRIAKYSSATSTYITTLATMKLTVSSAIANHPIIVANELSTATTITYDQLQGADTYYKMANGYHEDLTITVAQAVHRYDYDINAAVRTGQNTAFESLVDSIDLAPGTDTEAHTEIEAFINSYFNMKRNLTKAIDDAFFNPVNVSLEDGSRFDMTVFEDNTPTPQEWGWDSQSWDYQVVTDGQQQTLVRWDEGQALSVMFAEFPNFAIEASAEYGDDRIGWHAYITETKAGIEHVYYSQKFIYVTASGIPDHDSNWYDPTWTHLDEDNPNTIIHQNITWNIPGEVVVPLLADKEVIPQGPIALFRNGVVLYSAKTRTSHGNDGVWHYNAMYTTGIANGYGPGTEKQWWRHRDQYGGAIESFAGQYHYYANPTAIYNDMLNEHSPLLGYAWDGVPIYGPNVYPSTSYTGDGTTTIFAGPSGPEYNTSMMDDSFVKILVDGVDQTVTTNFTYTGAAGNEKSQITFGTAPANGTVISFTVRNILRKIRSSYRLKTGTRVAIGSEPSIPTGSYDGSYYEDFEYVAGLGDLDEYNGRFASTPEKPSGIYAYYVTLDDDNIPAYPYVIGQKYYGKSEPANYDITKRPVHDPDFNIGDPNKIGIPNISIDRQDRDSKDFVRATDEQWPDELIPISSKEGLQITVQTNNHYTLGSVTDWLSFRIYYDADGETKYYALPNDAKTTASAAITKLDTEISVTDVKVLPEPYMNSLGTGYTTPGVVFIGSERVEYLDIDIANNKLLHCRRGTGTTSVQDHAISTTIFSGDTNNILTYDTETTWSPHATNGLNASTSEQAVFLKNRSGNALA